MAAPEDLGWEVCQQCAADGGIGIRLPSGGRCWAHADDEDLEAALRRLGEDGRLDARGVTITSELLVRTLDAARHDDTRGHPVLTDARFDRATFQGDAGFEGAAFEGYASFSDATFTQWAVFHDATFKREATFGGVTFSYAATFGGATFQGPAVFSDATFEGGTKFNEATFKDTAWFVRATFKHETRFLSTVFRGRVQFNETAFKGEARFAKATFEAEAEFHQAAFERMAVFAEASFLGNAKFDGPTFQGDARFEGAAFHRDAGFGAATFRRNAQFDGATFHRDAGFGAATFQQTRQLGPMMVRKALVLDGAVFHERAQVEVAAAVLCCRRAQFLAGVQLRARWAQVVLDDADLAAPSTLTGAPPFAHLDEPRFARAWERLLQPVHIQGGRPRLLSMRRADVAGLKLSNVDLRACRFAGTHNLDKLRIEAEDAFGYPPTGWRWTNRHTIADEHHWRQSPVPPAIDPSTGPTFARPNARTPRNPSSWYRAAHQPPAWLEVERLEPTRIAVLYRALRKGREDSRDEPGAADFYYGEMEMRRQAKRMESQRAWRERQFGRLVNTEAEHLVLWLYWLLSGYALRASRALAWLSAVLIVATVVLAASGLEQPTPASLPARLGTAVLVAVEGAVFRASEQALTYTGRLTQAVLRFVGPVLLGLAVLSIRGRVKR